MLRRLWSIQVSYRTFCLVIVGLMMLASQFGCQHQDQADRPPRTFHEFQKLRDYRMLGFFEYLKAFTLAKSPDQQWWALQGMAKTVTDREENVLLRESLAESALASQGDKVAELNQTIVESCKDYPAAQAAYDALTGERKAEAFPSLVRCIQNHRFSDGNRLDVALGALQEALRLHMDSQVVQQTLHASAVGGYESVREAFHRLTFGSPAWEALLDYLCDSTADEPYGLVAYYNEAEPKVQHAIYTKVVRQSDRFNLVFVCEHAKPGTPLRNYALRQVTQGLTLNKALANYHASKSADLRQILAARIDAICQAGGDTDGDWLKVLESSETHTYLGIMAEERMRDIVARPTSRATLEQSSPEAAPVPRANPSIWGNVQSVYFTNSPSAGEPTTWGRIKANYR